MKARDTRRQFPQPLRPDFLLDHFSLYDQVHQARDPMGLIIEQAVSLDEREDA